jgi:hypothetical protein
MEIIKKLLEIILEFLNQRKEQKVESEEEVRLEVEQKKKVEDRLRRVKKKPIKTPKEDNFFGD